MLEQIVILIMILLVVGWIIDTLRQYLTGYDSRKNHHK